jgi:transposase
MMHHIPVNRSTLLLCELAGRAVSTGWLAGICGKAASLVEASGFPNRVLDLLKAAPAVHADETPGRGSRRRPVRAPGLHCLPDAHAYRGGPADAIDVGQVLPGYQGIIVRDGYHAG